MGVNLRLKGVCSASEWATEQLKHEVQVSVLVFAIKIMRLDAMGGARMVSVQSRPGVAQATHAAGLKAMQPGSQADQ